jgi:hypothetical protein
MKIPEKLRAELIGAGQQRAKPRSISWTSSAGAHYLDSLTDAAEGTVKPNARPFQSSLKPRIRQFLSPVKQIRVSLTVLPHLLDLNPDGLTAGALSLTEPAELLVVR